MKYFSFIYCLFFLLLGTEASGERPKIVSASLCGDAYLLALNADEQIIALSHLSKNTELSMIADRAQGFATTSGSAEHILSLAPDIVIAHSFTPPHRLEILRRAGIKLVVIEASRNMAQMEEEAMAIGNAIERTQEAKSWLHTMQKRIKQLEQKKRNISIIHYQRRGLATGKLSYLNDLMEKAGLTNLGAKNGTIERLGLEALIRLSPDYILFTSAQTPPQDRGEALLHHPAIEKHFSQEQRIYLPSSLFTCAGPFAAEALERLQQAIK